MSIASSDAVLIAGGGIGGFATALALARRGVASRILESRPEFGAEGAGIQIGPNGTRILQSLGVSEALKPHAGVPEAIAVRDGASGRNLARLPLGDWIAQRHGAPYWVVHRGDLHKVLVAATKAEPLISLSTGSAVAAAEASDGKVVVTTASGETSSGRALIGADGLWSSVRAAVAPGVAPSFAGKSAARSVLDLNDVAPELRRPQVGIWLFPDAHVVHYPVAGGSALAIVVIVADTLCGEDWSQPVSPQWVSQRLPPCAAALRDLVAAPKTWRRWALHRLAPLPAWTHGPVTLLGDAAHAIVPFLAQGAVLALEDAVVLADALHHSGTDTNAALRLYERQRRQRAERVGQASLQNGRIYHLSGLPALARNLALHAVPGELLMARYDWLYGWRAA
jgi:2-polyprenyl-6-methoxyphenol hydroxylase-like FAD-dependent oxidoreductase